LSDATPPGYALGAGTLLYREKGSFGREDPSPPASRRFCPFPASPTMSK